MTATVAAFSTRRALDGDEDGGIEFPRVRAAALGGERTAATAGCGAGSGASASIAVISICVGVGLSARVELVFVAVAVFVLAVPGTEEVGSATLAEVEVPSGVGLPSACAGAGC